MSHLLSLSPNFAIVVILDLWTKIYTSQNYLWPIPVCWGDMCKSTQGSWCPSPRGKKTVFKNFSQKVNNPKWCLDDIWLHICHTCISTQGSLTPIEISQVCGYSDHFSKTLTGSSVTLDHLWPHFCFGHMCDSTHGSLCPTPMEINQSM